MINALPPELPPHLLREAVQRALAEDLGQSGDITAQATLRPQAIATARINARDPGTVAGLELARLAFAEVDPSITFETKLSDGDALTAGLTIAEIRGPARAVMTAERTALNFLMHLSAIATHTARFTAAIGAHPARVTCTRKTTPGLRALEKYAVRCGGGSSHRMSLADAILIKDNHIAVCGSVKAALERAYAFAGHLTAVEIEVDTLEQFAEALDAGARIVLLDNMSLTELRDAVALNAGRATLEASGNVDLDTVSDIAATGVDYISTSKITMAAGTLDIGMDINIEGDTL
ncbi:carboxylating nicotinate-nucleotide diphosphorylase [Pontivivens insulae]|uniref:Probable nicotinate-nucleotide pyrophosphorylase [carboxylating] n=1 Tax=Pontivivens insulae TaxID=1639689 RepID=A0A2R8A8L6_9RHOB|nr:carboxylating nicotinate-nucleotide diphosphorylase [Pontivivens insulae]RED18587.1 nicotinate-nucleotide pyrophosphorylase [carboxylating] [Pontivivens insulae]SPF28485.1 putative nicotinate-nucleotide pyrophosphorylase [carboxylating] [Pontivivens insulae]